MKVTIITKNNYTDFMLDLHDARVELKDLESYFIHDFLQENNLMFISYDSTCDVVQFLDIELEIYYMNEYDYLDNLVSPVEFLEYVGRKSR